MILRQLSNHGADQMIAKGGVVVGTAITAQSVTEIGGAVGTVLGIVVACLSIWLLVWRIRNSRLENAALRREQDRQDRERRDQE